MQVPKVQVAGPSYRAGKAEVSGLINLEIKKVLSLEQAVRSATKIERQIHLSAWRRVQRQGSPGENWKPFSFAQVLIMVHQFLPERG